MGLTWTNDAAAGPIPGPRGPEPEPQRKPFTLPPYPERKKKERLCIICGQPFQPEGKRRTCSEECLSMARSTRAKETNRQRYGAPEDAPHTCAVCGAPVSAMPGRNYRYRKTCSEACFRIYRAEQAAERSRHKNLRRGSLPDAVIDREVARARADWDCDGSIADTPETIYGNMITL